MTLSVPYICQVNSDVCKLRIDYDTMVLTAPFSTTSSSVATDSTQTGDCQGCIFYLGLPGVYIYLPSPTLKIVNNSMQCKCNVDGNPCKICGRAD